MIVTSNDTFATHIPAKGGKYQLIAPTANVLTDEEYSKIKDSASFIDGVERGVYVVKGLKAVKENDNQGDMFEDEKPEDTEKKDDLIKSTLGETIIGITPNDAINIIKDIHVKSHLEEALTVEKRQKVRKAINDQLKGLEIEETENEEQ